MCAGLALVGLFIETVPPDDMTVTAIGETMMRIQMHMKSQRDYPRDLSELPKLDGHTNQVTDGWGRTLLYSVDEMGVISLTSFGRDGKPGGDGLDQDIVHRQRTRDDDGKLNIDEELWDVTSEIWPD